MWEKVHAENIFYFLAELLHIVPVELIFLII